MDFLPRAKDDFHMTESISATSALVLLMGKEYYTSGFAKKFLDSMDLNSGLAMKNLADKVWSNYGEIVKNRKDSIYRAIAGNSDEINQVVILACGYDALALNIAEKNERFSIFEVDMYNMDEKSAKYDSMHLGDMQKRMSIMTCDITSSELFAKLESAGWDSQKPTIIVAEGISYYLRYEQFWDLASQFSSENSHNCMVADYMVPMHKMDLENRARMSGVFKIICDNVDLDFLTVYEYENMHDRIIKIGGKPVSHETLHMMEFARTGKNTYFDQNSRSGIETCSFKI